MSNKASTKPPLPDFDKTFINDADIAAFSRAINAPDASEEDHFITALNDWRPVNTRIRKKRARRRGKDETREGFVYTLTKWPLLVLVFTWIAVLSILYVMTRFYISQYEYWITWRGERNRLRKKLRKAESYKEWVDAAKELDRFLGGAEKWMEEDAFAYYDHATVRRILRDLRKVREKAEQQGGKEVEELRSLVEACVKNNFAGIESARMYSQTYYGTKHLVQNFVDEVEKCLKFLCETDLLSLEEKRVMFKQLSSNYGRTALCLSGGACFSYYHLGVIKAHLDANLLPKIITGTSGGALVAALACTRTDSELKQLLVPELADKITACHDDFLTWFRRWLRTGARFDSIDWARRCCWFTRGSMTFKEAYQRTGRILNISCVPSDPHTPSLLLNYLTAPDCCIFSAVLASAAVPGILNPVVLMTRTRHGTIAPYSFGNKWKDGSLRTDIPIRSLNLHFNVNFSIVSQVNPHVNIFFFSSRGSVGRPVTHRRGKGWRGGFLGSAMEQYLKLDMAKWLKVLRHLELLPRPMSQDWSSVFLQKFDGTITLWPKTVLSDFWFILSDPSRERLERMLETGQRCTYSKLKFVENRLKIERVVEHGRNITRSRASEIEEVFGNGDDHQLQKREKRRRSSNAAESSSPTATTTGISSWFPWSKSPRASFDGTGEGEGEGLHRRGNGEAVADVGVEEEEGWSSSCSSSDGEQGVDAGGGRVVREGERVEKFEARGETVLGA
ncbi:FabD/lysophospholipase-like protein [Wilcoxina mikolae CBS 423.85]|nr:FabD/lysophospholipase-like protein [Wilcoxina mikolae CBS 423.85]